jgi:hypothetical protein
MNYEKCIIQINVQKKDIDLNHPLNLFKNYKSSGTGFFIDKNMILTCYHVIEAALDINVSLIKNNQRIEIKANIKYIFPNDDLAIIEINENDIDFLLLDFYIITNKENIFKESVAGVNTLGYPLNSKSLITNKGIISGFKDSLIQTDSTLNSGNSGGPLIFNNKIIGISQSKLIGDVANFGFAIPIIRFLILWEEKKNLKLINKKPSLLFKYQEIKQKNNHYKNGVMITKIHPKSILRNTNIEINDYLLEINNHIIDDEGNLKFNFFPEKINLNEIHLWFPENYQFIIKHYSRKQNQEYINTIKLKNVNTNLIQFYPEISEKYYWENSGLIFSVFTDYHLENIKTIEINIYQRIKLLNRFLDFNDLFTVYLADIDFTKLKFTSYPIGDIIIEINDIAFDNIDTFKKIINEPLKKIKTINNEIFFIN